MKDPMGIENRSFEIIDEQIKGHTYSPEEYIVVKRTIHTTGDFDYKNIVSFQNDPINNAKRAFVKGARIVTDTRMAFSGINKSALKRIGMELECFIDDERAFERAKENSTTRSMAAVELAADSGTEIYVIGNAPTALFRIGELIESGKIAPSLVIGVPVGFVGAAESKELLRKWNVPSISTIGTKGGSNVAAAIVNALLYMVSPREE